MGEISVITSEIFVAYSQCPRKAFLLLFSEDKGKPHDYPLILEERRDQNRTRYLEKFLQSHPDAKQYEAKDFKKHELLLNATLKSAQLEAYCAALIRVDNDSENRRNSYEPAIVVGTHSITSEQKIELSFVGLILERIQKQLPAVGRIVTMDEKVHRVKLEKGYKGVKAYLKTLESWCSTQTNEAPALILNKHCPSCQFRDICREQAEKENNLSLLDRMTPKAIQTYNKRGIFTVQQLSYLFRPRRKRKKLKSPEPVKHSLELQALAIRERKIYIQEMPELVRQPVELFLDIEGIPDQRFHYLMGLLVCEGESSTQYSFWADAPEDEEKIWNQLLSKLDEYPKAPIYHYGSYEKKALNELAKKYSSEINQTMDLLVNVNSYIYGKIYFPLFSNTLKDLCNFIGFSWSESEASGLKSLAWRFAWEFNHDTFIRQKLIKYNLEDCFALRALIRFLSCNFDGKSQPEFELMLTEEIALNPHYKFGKSFPQAEDLIELREYAYFDYQRERILFRDKITRKTKPNRRKKISRSQEYRVNKVIAIPRHQECYECGGKKLDKSVSRQKTVLSLKFLKDGVKRWVVRYTTERLKCRSCLHSSIPIEFRKIKKYGYELNAWIVYQHVALRQPYNRIREGLNAMFGIDLSESTLNNAQTKMSEYHTETYNSILAKLRNGNLICADETHVRIKGKDAYIWVFTSLEEVVYTYSPTREGNILEEIIKDFKGVLVSDFYNVYDSADCAQQKCLIHLIRDMNDALIENPFDDNYRELIKRFGVLVKSIILTIDKYGMKKRHLRRHIRVVEGFYKWLLKTTGESECFLKYKNRLTKYREKLFEFLNHDNIPWNNNNAEHAIKAFAAYRKIADGNFTESGLKGHLPLLSIYQTCKYKNIDFLKFLLSNEKDIDFV